MLSKNPIAVPKIPTIVKKQKFIILTAVLDVILRLVKCKTGTSREERLAFAASTQNRNAIKYDLISNIKKIQISKIETKVITEAFFKNCTL